MSRKVWKWMFGISVAMLVLLTGLTIAIWLLSNVALVLLMMMDLGRDPGTVQGVGFAELLVNFVGSPMFYAYIVDLTALIGSAVMLVVTRKKAKRNDETIA